MSEAILTRLSLGSLLTKALGVARQRWGTLAILIVSLDWAPHLLMGVSGVHRYNPSSHDAAAFAAFTVQSVALSFCSMLMQASVVAVGLGGLREPAPASKAMGRVLRRLPTLAPWWLLVCLPTAATLWIDWSSNSYAQLNSTYVWRQLGSGLFDIAISCAIGLFSLVVLAENLSSLPTLRRTWRLMSGRRGTVFIVAFTTDIVSLMINLAIPYLTYSADVGLGRTAWFVAAYGASLLWETQAAVANLLYVELYRDLVWAHDGIESDELAHIFA